MSTKMADMDAVETTPNPKKGKLTADKRVMLKGKSYVAIRLGQTANAVGLNVLRS